jgi:hypothetical protein
MVDLDDLFAQLVILVGDPGLGGGVQHDAQSFGVQFLCHGFILGAHEFQILGGLTADDIRAAAEISIKKKE